MVDSIHVAQIQFFGVLFVVLTAPLGVAADNWPQWRGPAANNVAAEGDYPVDFSREKGVAWKAALPGVGCSTPAVWGDSIFLTCGIDGQDGVVCYAMDGSERWRRQLGPERPGKHRNGSGSNPSPVTDGKYVVAYFKSGTVTGLTIDGRELWRFNLQAKYGADSLWWDIASSPALAGDRVLVAVMQDGNSYVIALDLATGDVLWKVPREYACPQESDQAYASPQVVKIDGRDVLVTLGSDHLTGHDVESGKLLWECGGFNPDQQTNWRVIASAAIDGDVAFVPYGRGECLAGIRLGGSGDVTATNRLWEKRGRGLGAEVPTPVIRAGKVYLLGDSGRVACFDVESGDELWSGDLPRSRNRYFSSPVLAGDQLYCPREDGKIFVGRVSDAGFELLAENDMGEAIIAAPVPIRDGLLIRGREHLFRIEQ
jgi:outer membrane protein assembly factor BamB